MPPIGCIPFLAAQNAKQKLAARLDRAGLRVTSADSSQDYHAALSLRSYSCLRCGPPGRHQQPIWASVLRFCD